MDAVLGDHDVSVPPGEDDEGAPGDRVQHPGAFSLDGDARAALPGLIQVWRDKWEISLRDGMFTAVRRDIGPEGGVTYPEGGPEIACTDPDMFDAELRRATR